MNKLIFKSSDAPTLGVEIELALVDNATMALSSSIHDVLQQLPEKYAGAIKPELMQCYLEINTGVCSTVAAADADLREKLRIVEAILDNLDLSLLWTATHPFSLWRDQRIVATERYQMLLNLLQDMGRQLTTCGLHVHAGVDSGDKAVMICDRLLQYLPLLLALSCNSPRWENRTTGLHSNRSKIMEALPTAGLPTLVRNWSEYTWLINHLMETGFINTIREIWWDIRPHHNFGTVEIRICDMPGRLEEVLALTALIQCLVKSLSDQIDEGTYQLDCHPMIVRQNKWRACRYGLDANLVDSYTFESRSAREMVPPLVQRLRPIAQELDCEAYLDQLLAIAAGPSGADRQLAALDAHGHTVAALRSLTAASRVSS